MENLSRDLFEKATRLPAYAWRLAPMSTMALRVLARRAAFEDQSQELARIGDGVRERQSGEEALKRAPENVRTL